MVSSILGFYLVLPLLVVLYYFFFNILFYVYGHFVCTYVGVCMYVCMYVCAPRVCLVPAEIRWILELQMVLIHHVRAGNETPVLLQERPLL